VGCYIARHCCPLLQYVSSFKKSDKNSAELQVAGNNLSQLCKVSESYAEYFTSFFNNAYLCDPSIASRLSHLASLSDSDVPRP
jgi:hypothetical protein